MFVEFSLNFPRLALDLVAVDLALVAILPLGIVVVFVLGRAARAGRARSSVRGGRARTTCPARAGGAARAVRARTTCPAHAGGAARAGRAQTTCPARAGGAARASRARTTRASNAARAPLSGGAARAGRAALVVVSVVAGSVPQGIFSTFVPVGLQACPGVAVRVVVVLVSYILRRIQSALDRDVALLDLVCVALRSVC